MQRTYKEHLTASINRKGVLDVDTVKGCTLGIQAYPDGGCYGTCYAKKCAECRGFDFSKSISRDIHETEQIEHAVKTHNLSWFRIGVMGDPCHDWPLTLCVCMWLSKFKTPVIVTKHWEKIPEPMLRAFVDCGCVFNTSISALDTVCELKTRLEQHERINNAGGMSALRVVTCKFSDSIDYRMATSIQAWLLGHKHVIDNPLRIHSTHKLVASGMIKIQRHVDLGGGSMISIANDNAYIGTCDKCPDQCGVTFFSTSNNRKAL